MEEGNLNSFPIGQKDRNYTKKNTLGRKNNYTHYTPECHCIIQRQISWRERTTFYIAVFHCNATCFCHSTPKDEY